MSTTGRHGTAEHPTDATSASTTDTELTDFRAATAAEWREAFLTGDVSAVELTTSALTAQAVSASLGAFLHVDADLALARAAELDQVREAVLDGVPDASRASRLSDLSARDPLLGLPTAFKDLVDVAGMPTTLGTAALDAAVPPRDADLARRVHRAGTVSIGKTQVPEFGLPCYSENDLGAPSRNPLDPARTSGGSTGGGAAAVAAGILPLAPGNDGGGSVRIPAAACGLVGLKPGRGRMPDDPREDRVTNLAVSGPIARTAEDAALLFDVMAGARFTVPGVGGPDGGSDGGRRRRRAGRGRRRGTDDDGADVALAEGPAMRAVRRALAEGLAPLQVGVVTESPFSPELDILPDEEAIRALEAGVAGLAGRGHAVQGTEHCTGGDRFWPSGYHEDFRTLWTSRLAGLELEDDARERLRPLTRHFLELAADRTAEQTRRSVTAMQRLADDAEAMLGPWDVLMTPMLGLRPPEVGWFAGLDPAEDYVQQCRFTPWSSVVNVMGLPAINVPVHADAEGMSWSVQLIGRRGSEEQLLALGATLQQD
ncbi:amidase [Nesterenkonia sp. F]|uniref:amidase n=1 Tax=Nesterenkonia sp. F TaxID=795955 RepID=UPI000255D148|nr:amidase [Nesterenkonia sp. F]